MATLSKIAGVAQKKVKKVGFTHCAYAAKYGFTDRWTPAQLSNKLLWLRAYKIVPKADGTVLVNNDWVDESGKGYNPTVSGTTAPLYRLTGSNSQNGLPTVEFSGANGFQFASNPSAQESDFDLSALGIFAGAKKTSGSGASIITKNTTSTGGGGRRKLQTSVNSNLAYSSGTDGNAINTAMTTTNFNIVGVVSRNNSDHDLIPNGTVVNNTTTLDVGTTPNNARVELGQAFSNGAERLVGVIGELFVMGVAPTSAERALIVNYLGGVWGVTVA